MAACRKIREESRAIPAESVCFALPCNPLIGAHDSAAEAHVSPFLGHKYASWAKSAFQDDTYESIKP